MQEIYSWVLSNKEWLFSGVGLLVITIIAKIFFRSKKDGNKSNKQKIRVFTIGSKNKTENTQKNEQ
ncbi:hypothetical protein ACSJES_003173 [Yersinia enterocolitica]